MSDLTFASLRAVIDQWIGMIGVQQNRRLAPLHEDQSLFNFGFDSLCFAILVERLETEFGLDPFMDIADDEVPNTLGEFYNLYARALIPTGPQVKRA